MHDLDRTQMETWEGEMYPSESYAYEGGPDWENQQNGQEYIHEGDGEWPGDREWPNQEGWYSEQEGEWPGESGEFGYGEQESDGEWPGDREWPNQEGWYSEQEGEWPMGSGEFGYGQQEGEWPTESGKFGYGEYQGSAPNPEMPFSESDEINLAAELLSVGSEQEFDRYMNDLFITANRGQFQPGSQELFGALGGLLKNLLKKAVPIGATVLGGPVAGLAAQAFGLETEGLSPENEQFEIARSYVRLAGAASQEAAQIPPGSPAEPAAQQALVMAAQRHAPGMMYDGQPAQAPYPKRMPKRGTWTRRGNSIMLHGYFGPSGEQGWR